MNATPHPTADRADGVPTPRIAPFRLPPHNLEAEVAVLGSMLLDPGTADEVLPILREDDFYRDVHRAIFAAIRDMRNAGHSTDLVGVDDWLRRAAPREHEGWWSEFCGELVDGVPSTANAGYYARIVGERATARAVLEASIESEREVYSSRYTCEELVEAAERRIFAISRSRLRGSDATVVDAIDAASGAIERRAMGEVPGVPSGFGPLDDLIGGFQPGNLIIVAARPGHGKSAFALNACDHAAVRLGIRPLLISLEMERAEVGLRLLQARAGVDSYRLQNAWVLSDEERGRLEAAKAELRANAWPIDDTTGRTASEVASIARRAVAKEGVGLVVVDYLQLLEGEADSNSPRHEQIEKISRRLKNLAGELKVPVVALSQLNRQSEGREGHRPRLAELRSSGALEQDANVVILIHRPEVVEETDQPGVAEFIVAKNRAGRTGTIRMRYVKEYARFESPEIHL